MRGESDSLCGREVQMKATEFSKIELRNQQFIYSFVGSSKTSLDNRKGGRIIE
jgi:hypothetical protein